jgi:hypothetical protein
MGAEDAMGAGSDTGGMGTGVDSGATVVLRKKIDAKAKPELARAAQAAKRTGGSTFSQSQMPSPALSAEAVSDNTVLTWDPKERVDIQGPRQRSR